MVRPHLGVRAAVSTLAGIVLTQTILCVSAGTLRFWQAWFHCAIQVATMMAANTYMLKTCPELLEKRLLSRREPDPAQRVGKALLLLAGLSLYAVAGLDRREGWSHVPTPLVVMGFLLHLAGALLVFLVLVENRFASSVVELATEQRVVAGGPYRFVRHPMYLAALLQGAASSIALGSWWAELPVAGACIVVVARLLGEERLLRANLAGYEDYVARTPHRLVPLVW